jgi:hypothetical protein
MIIIRHRLTTILKTLGSGLVWPVAGAGIVAPVGGLFGLYFATVMALLRHETAGFVATLLFCTACGAAAGAILGGYWRWFDGVNPLSNELFFSSTLRPFRTTAQTSDLPDAIRSRVQSDEPIGTEQHEPTAK